MWDFLSSGLSASPVSVKSSHEKDEWNLHTGRPRATIEVSRRTHDWLVDMAQEYNLGSLNKTTRELVAFFASGEGPSLDCINYGKGLGAESLRSPSGEARDLPFTRVCRIWLGQVADSWGCNEGDVLEKLCDYAREEVDLEQLFEVGRKYTSTADLYNDCGIYERIA